jgi:hypothetical protein
VSAPIGPAPPPHDCGRIGCIAFIDTLTAAEQAVRDAQERLAVVRDNGPEQEALRATVELSGARIALAILAAADLLSENRGAGSS